MRHSWEEQKAEKCIGCAQEPQLVPCTQVRRDNLGQSEGSMNAFVPGRAQKKKIPT